MVQMKVHDSYRKVVALCDSELIGKKFEEGKKQLDLRENFYKGEELDREKLLEMLRNFREDDATFNIVGKEAVKLSKEAGIVSEGNLGKVDGIPFALVLL